MTDTMETPEGMTELDENAMDAPTPAPGRSQSPSLRGRQRRPQDQEGLDLGGELGPRHVPTDVKDIIGLVAKRHNILMRPDDPALVIVTIFEAISARHMAAMTEEVNRGLDALAHSAEEQIDASRTIAGRIVNEGGDYIAGKIRNAGETMGPEIAKGVLAALAPTLNGIVAETAAAKKARSWAMFAAALAVVAGMVAVGAVLLGGG